MTRRNFDCVVIGSGPAGLAAATAAAEAGASVVSVDRMGPGGQLMNLGELIGVEGLEGGSTGPDLIALLAEQAMASGVELAIDEVTAARCDDLGLWWIDTLDGGFQAKALVMASGLTPGTTGVADEARYEGQGLSHCAHCDAPLYAGRPVLVVGDDAWTVEEAIALADYASTVTLVTSHTPDAPPERLAELMGRDNIAIIEGKVAGLHGEAALEKALVEAGGSVQKFIEAHGLFVYTGRKPALSVLEAGSEAAPGLFWAGDVRPETGRTITEAIADGAEAGQNAANWAAARSS
ncbi:MAG: NAD(P)/FAD-dependent oxidoreductase [Hyphomicrobiaceae bacterium]